MAESSLIKKLSKPYYWFRTNIKYLKHGPQYIPSEKNNRPIVLMVPIFKVPEPFYQTWLNGIESAGWNYCCLYRSYDEIQVSDQLLLYFFLCFRVQAVHLIDLDFQTLFGERNTLRYLLSFTVLGLMVWFPRLLGKKIVYSFGNITPHENNTQAELKRHRFICSQVDDVISLSPALTESLINLGIPEDRIWPVEHADISSYFQVKSDYPDFRAQYGIPPAAIILLYVGNIRPYKGIELAIEGFKRTKNPLLRLFLSGQPSAGYLAEDILRLTQDDPRIILGPLRFLSNEEMGWFFRAADYCLLSYLNIGHSGLICQSLGLGVPVIASRVGCLPDYLQTGTGLLFNPNDPDDLADLLDKRLAGFDRGRAKAIGLSIMRKRTTECIGQRLVRVYEYRKGGKQPETNWLF